ncbi:MAG TPA: hypothetical protein VE136_10910 [Anaerolineales bacterium]|jgi:hypothetical protein|nr:hypothetical protein [Anaerolineales bacterium]
MDATMFVTALLSLVFVAILAVRKVEQNSNRRVVPVPVPVERSKAGSCTYRR